MVVSDRAHHIYDWMVELRRELHRRPELAFEEVETAQVLCRELERLGIPFEHAGPGSAVVGRLSCGDDNKPTIALRADMDALPGAENTDLPFASSIEGKMHACGHDAHMAMVMGAAALLKESPPPCNVLFLFQPAEEDEDEAGVASASRMIEDGALIDVDAVIALHLDSTQPCGTVTVHRGWNSAAVDSFEAWLVASGGHGAYPHRANDPIWMLGPVLMALHGIVARRIDPIQPAVLSLGQVQAGTTSNVATRSSS